jgi:hypothetical protein
MFLPIPMNCPRGLAFKLQGGVLFFAISFRPRWTVQNRPLIDGSKPATRSGRPRLSEFYFVPFSVRKSVCSFVRQLRGPHLSTCA